MKPVTQTLRAFIETDPPKAKGGGLKRKSPLADQKMEMAEIERAGARCMAVVWADADF
jgi:hypothetical protein